MSKQKPIKEPVVRMPVKVLMPVTFWMRQDLPIRQIGRILWELGLEMKFDTHPAKKKKPRRGKKK